MALIARRLRLIILFLLLLSMESNNLLALTMVKGWINQIRPGTFEEKDATTDVAGGGGRSFTEAEMKILTDLARREEDLKRKEASHQQRAIELKSLSQQIEQKLDQIRKLTADFEKKRQLRQEMDEKDISRMVRYYETMDPERTAVFFNQMDRITATHLLMRMNPRKAATVMELLNPQVAVEITEMVTRFKEDRAQVLAQ